MEAASRSQGILGTGTIRSEAQRAGEKGGEEEAQSGESSVSGLAMGR